MHKKTSRFWLQALGALVIGVVATSAQAKPPSGGGWVKHNKLSPVRGADGKMHTASCSGYPGTDPKFSFWTKKGKSKNLAVYFEGGGACWDNLTCTFPINDQLPAQVPQFFVPAIDAATNPGNYDGIFKSDNPDNPVKDWTMVYIPYCTGDLHAGSTSKTYFNAGHPVLSLPAQFTLQHKGFDNFMVVLDWMKKNVEDPKKVLVTGSSAGGYGASANFPWVQRSFRKAQTYVIADASQGVTGAMRSIPGGVPRGTSSWHPGPFGDDPSAVSGPDLLRTAALALPKVKTAQFTTTFDNRADRVLRRDETALPVPGHLFQPGSEPEPDHRHRLETPRCWQPCSPYDEDVPNFRYYLAQGNYHTLLRSPLFYTESSGGVAFNEWVEDMLDNEGGRHGHGHGHGDGGWKNAVCTDCLVPTPCP